MPGRIWISCLTASVLAWASSTARAAEGAVIFDQRGYVREWIEFGCMRIAPEALQAEGESLFSRGGSKPNYRRIFGRYVGAANVDWSGTAWMKDVRVTFFRGQWGSDSQALPVMPEVAPPEGWASPDFDDSAWLCRRLGARKPVRDYQENFRDSSDALVRNSYYRTYVEVDDPTSCGDLILRCRYRGGIRVWVNGAEVAFYK